MPDERQTHITPKWRTLWLALGFAVLAAIGAVTVFRPELEDEPLREDANQTESGRPLNPDAPLQE